MFQSYVSKLTITILDQRILAPLTHFQKFVENFKIEFPGNGTKTLISPEWKWFTGSVPIFRNNKIANGKKFCRFLIRNSTYLSGWFSIWFSKSNGFGKNPVRCHLDVSCRWCFGTSPWINKLCFWHWTRISGVVCSIRYAL